jgi:hypothetical protein
VHLFAVIFVAFSFRVDLRNDMKLYTNLRSM